MSAPAGAAAPAATREHAGVRSALPLLGAIVLLTINLRTVIASLPPLLSDVRADLGLSATVAGLLTTLPVVCFGALAPIAPRLAHHVSLERMLVACVGLTAVAAGIRGVDGTAALFCGSVLAGAAVAVAQTSLPVLIRTRHPERTGLLTGAYSMALPLGATLASATSVPLQHALGGSWRAALAAWAVPAAVATAVWLPVALGTGTRMRGPAPAPLRNERMAWWVAGFFGLQSMAFYAGLAWLPTILEAHGFSAGAAGTLQALNALISAGPAFLVPMLASRGARQLELVVAVVAIAAAGVLGLLLAPSAAAAWMLLIGLGQGGALGLALTFPLLRASGARAVASLTAMTLCAGYLVAATGPWLLGAVHDATDGWNAPLAVMLAITLSELLPGLAAARGRMITA